MQQCADLDVGFDLYAQFLQVLYDRAIDGTAQVGVLIRNNTSLVSYAIVDILGFSNEPKFLLEVEISRT